MFQYRIYISAVLMVGVWVSQAHGACNSELSPSEREQLLRSGEPLVKTCGGESASEVWGRTWVYGVTRANPEEVAAIYSDYDHHRDFMLNVLRSEVSESLCPTTHRVYFEINVPAVRNEKQMMWHRLTQQGNEYMIQFKLGGPSTFMRDIVGELKVLPLENGGTLLVHRDVIVPGKMALKFGSRETANQNLKNTVAQLAEALDEKRGKVQNLIDRMRSQLSAPGCAIPVR